MHSSRVLEQLLGILTPDTSRDVLIPILTEIGYLVPFAKKKRCMDFSQVISEDLHSIWTPVLSEAEKLWPGFVQDLIMSFLGLLSSYPSTESVTVEGSSQDDTKRGSKSYAYTTCNLAFIIRDIEN